MHDIEDRLGKKNQPIEQKKIEMTTADRKSTLPFYVFNCLMQQF